jgi:hypothetical protein
MQQSKSERIKRALESGDWLTALKIASRFFDRSEDTLIFKRGIDAYRHPAFYDQLGKNPEQIVNEAVSLLRRRFLD